VDTNWIRDIQIKVGEPRIGHVRTDVPLPRHPLERELKAVFERCIENVHCQPLKCGLG
jgi:hypothetical protein